MRASRPFASVLFALTASAVAQGGWVQRQPVHTPPPRGWHGLAYDMVRGVHVLFGGGENGVYGDTWEWDGLDWLQRTPANAPPARLAHAMTYDLNRSRIVMTGGRALVGPALDDTWEFDGVNWAQRFPQQSPPARLVAGLAFSVARGRSILFGGDDGTFTPALFQDTWEWDGVNWAQLTPTHAPPARSGFGIATDFVGGRVLVFGGFDNTVLLSDAWAFDGVDWTPLPATQSPPPLVNGVLAADLARGMLVQFGGLATLGHLPTNETSLHDGSDWRRDARPTSIGPRRTFALSYDWQRDRAVLFGGYYVGWLDETWEYDLAGVALWWVAGAGCAGTQGVPQLQPAGPQRAILGTSFGLEVSGGVTGGAVFALGFSNTSWNGNPLPTSLAGFGMPGCQLHTSIEFSSFAAGLGGTAQVVLAMPNDPGLVGVRFFAQALVPQPGVNAFGAVMSNAVAEVVGAF